MINLASITIPSDALPDVLASYAPGCSIALLPDSVAPTEVRFTHPTQPEPSLAQLETIWQMQQQGRLDNAIAAKAARINAERDRRISQLTWNGRTWDFDPESQRLILAETTYATAGVRPDDAIWIDADNAPIALSNSDFIALATAGREHYESLFFVAREYKNGLSNLTSIEEVETYPDWPESVP